MGFVMQLVKGAINIKMDMCTCVFVILTIIIVLLYV